MSDIENKTVIYFTRRSRNLTFKQWIIDLFEDERGITSIKPLIAFFGSLFIMGSMVINGATGGRYLPSDSLIDAVLIITGIGLGADTIDKFSKRKIVYNNNNVEDAPDEQVEKIEEKNINKDDVL